MTGLIKANNHAVDVNIQDFISAKPVPKSKVVRRKAIDPIVAENKQLYEQIEALEKQIEIQRSAIEAAYEEGVSDGRIAREAEFDDDRKAQLELLEASFSKANNALSETLSRLDVIAALVACSVLEKIFGDASKLKDLVIDLIQHQFVKIDREMVVDIVVSRTDFANTSEVSKVAETLNIEPAQLRVMETLKSGDCLINLKLGELDIGLNHQWHNLKNTLMSLSKEIET
jgi:flagellar biosynthesis/type III secretory pathway protein FliH